MPKLATLRSRFKKSHIQYEASTQPRDINLLSTVLTPSLPLISSSPNDSRDESGLGYVAKQEAKVEGVVIRTILSGDRLALTQFSAACDNLRAQHLRRIPRRKGIQAESL
ncbi:hypothetical protein CKAN_01034700 [Cinnamomum micranthum f. kanehirae]|uniref:Uncharacterized protein n=1 Tax=Cinnamomum micranthum f. kanehirae TaxID=337451 RepID=A0A3S3QAB5_9MAGN|nr:hypothetical protein CKAN_01034700 [Cinnamomum micranthum f. kanehirae]